MQQICTQCHQTFEITDSDLEFYDKVSPVFNGKKEPIPAPTQCPACRVRRRLSHRNHMYVHRAPSVTTGKEIMSSFPKESGIRVMEAEEWWQDRHDPLEEGREVDLSQPLFPQILGLLKRVPLYARSILSLQGSEYSNNASYLKDCYLLFNVSYAEDCMYGESTWHAKDCIDCTYTYNCELCYDCTACNDCYNVQGSEFSDNCSDSHFLSFCRGCRNCFGCANLRNKEYCFFNEQLTKEEYEQRLGETDLSSWATREAVRDHVMQFWMRHPRPHMSSSQADDSSGNFLSQTQNVHESFFARNAQNIRYGYCTIDNVRDCMDFTIYGDGAELSYECLVAGDGAYHVCFCEECWDNVSELLYCMFCVGSSDCFGCVGLHKKKYCILNKQYTKEEYEELVPRIIEHMRATGEWGEFFPAEASPYPYNHTLAHRYFPLERSQAEAQGFYWHDRETEDIAAAIDSSSLPDGLPASDEQIVAKSVHSGRPFKITSQEIKRYRQFRVPLPRMAYDERMDLRAQKLGGITLYDRTCAKTGQPIRTTVPPDSPWIVWDRDVWEQEFSG